MNNVSLFKHQQMMLDFAKDKNRLLWYAGMSTGKTVAALEWFKKYDGLKIVLSPKSAMNVWEQDYNEFNYNTYYDLVVMDKGTSKTKRKALDKLADTNTIVVISYDTAWRIDLSSYNIAAIVADEGHNLGSHNAKRTNKLTHQCSHIKNKILMTGTLYDDSPLKIYAIYRWLFPVKVRRHYRCELFKFTNGDYYSYYDFIYQFFNYYTINNIVIAKEPKNLPRLINIIKPYTLKIETKDVVRLPEKVETIYTYALEPKTKKAYNEFMDTGSILLDETFILQNHHLPLLSQSAMLLSTGIVKDIDDNEIEYPIKSRMSVLETILESIGTQAPIVIFTRFKRDVEIIKDLLNEDVAELTGDKDNHLAWANGDYRILIANLSAGSTGVRLQRAEYVIFWNVEYSLTNFNQAISRVVRNNNPSDSVSIMYIYAKDTIEEIVYNVLRRKNKIKHQSDSELELT